MTAKEAVNWITNIMADIGKSEHSDLWHYEQALTEIREMLEFDAQQWIPCKTRLPEEYGEYRITWITSAAPGKRFICDAEFEVTSVWDNEHNRFEGEWLLDDYIENNPDVEVLAWKPLEEPWKGEQE